MRQNKKLISASLLLGLVMFVLPVAVLAQSSSPNYRVEESYFGTGGEVDATSDSYRARQSTGSLGVGNASSSNFDAAAGFTTPTEIFLELVVSGADIDFGNLDPGTTSFAAAQGGDCNCSFYVRSYLSSGYVVVTASNPPTSESDISFTPKAVQGLPSSDPNVEEFGINLVANTTLANFGANPENIPDGTFADGEAATGYNIADQFKYGAGDIIARSQATAGNQGVGHTNYTISYIMKPKDTTAAGQYVMRHVIVATATF